MGDRIRCPECWHPLPTDAPEGLCPECLLRLAMENVGIPEAPEAEDRAPDNSDNARCAQS